MGTDDSNVRSQSASRQGSSLIFVRMVAIQIAEADRSFAHGLQSRFARKAGSEHIATECALQYLSACLRAFKPANVLELGAGIGTVTEALLTHPCQIQRLVSIETDEFCLRTFRRNLTNASDSRLTVVSTPAELAGLYYRADLVVGDGGFYSHEEVMCAKEGTVVFVEGNRQRLRQLFMEAVQRKNQKLEFQQFGASRGYRLGTIRFCFLTLPTFRRVSQKGCWIGRIESAEGAQWRYVS